MFLAINMSQASCVLFSIAGLEFISLYDRVVCPVTFYLLFFDASSGASYCGCVSSVKRISQYFLTYCADFPLYEGCSSPLRDLLVKNVC